MNYQNRAFDGWNFINILHTKEENQNYDNQIQPTNIKVSLFDLFHHDSSIHGLIKILQFFLKGSHKLTPTISHICYQTPNIFWNLLQEQTCQNQVQVKNI